MKYFRVFIIYIFSFLLFLSSAAYALDGASVDPSNSLLNARQLGMGGVGLGFANDANGVFSNPSYLTKLDFPQLSVTSRKLILDEVQYTQIDWAMPTNNGTFGFGYVSLGVGGALPTTLDPASGRIIIDASREATSYGNSVMAFSYSRQVRSDLSLGGALKLFNQSLSGTLPSKASGFGLDLSASYKPMIWLTLGANLQNLLEGNLQWENGAKDKIGGFYKLGCKLDILGPVTKEAIVYNQQKLFGGLDIDFPHSSLSSTAYHLGVEYFPMPKIALRSGFNLTPNGTGFALGIGLINAGFRFDYAYYQNPGIPGDTPHYFSLCYIGERVVSKSLKLIKKEPLIKFLQPTDHFITDLDSISITLEASAKRVVDQSTFWTVTAVSETKEVHEIYETEKLDPIYFNGIKLEKSGTIETSSPLNPGRNVFRVEGYTLPETVNKTVFNAIGGSSEVRVLRFSPFTDTPLNYWAIEPIALSVTLGLVKGYPNNTFKPEAGISRAELITLLVRNLPIDLEGLTEEANFRDVPAKHWATKFIAYGVSKNLVTGYPDKTFKPNKVINRAEGITLLARYAELPEENVTTSPFPDLKADFWANKNIEAARKSGMLKYLEGKEFKPSDPFTRAEACEVLYRVPQITKRVNDYWDTGMAGSP